MKMKHNFNYIAIIGLLVFVFVRCTEIYEPDISAGDVTALVVDGLITDGEGPFQVKLSLAKPMPYNSDVVTTFIVRGAKVNVADSEKSTFPLSEDSPGIYTLPSYFRAKTGLSYQLQIVTKDGKRYESTFQKLLPPQKYDSIRTMYALEDFVNDKNELKQVRGADLRMDLFQNLNPNDSIVSCRFKTNLGLQYNYTYRDRDINGNEIMSYHWVVFGWKAYKLNVIENITEKQTSTESLIKNHPIGFVPFDASSYGYVIPPPKLIYFIRVSQYSLNRDAYRFYKSANEQLSTSGNLFDPISSQVYGNMRCVNDPEKIVVGLFEVSAVTEHAFVLDNINLRINQVSIRKAPLMNLPANSVYEYRVWDLMMPAPTNDPTYTPIPLPSWWYHK